MSWRVATAIVDALGDPIVVVDAAGTILFANGR
jgi:hypothetical protein